MSYQILTRDHPQHAFEFAGFATKQPDESFDAFLRRVASAQHRPVAWVKAKPAEGAA